MRVSSAEERFQWAYDIVKMIMEYTPDFLAKRARTCATQRGTRKRVRREEASDASEDFLDARRREALSRRAALGAQVRLRL